MVITTENKLLSNYQAGQQTGGIKNPILEKYAAKSRSQPGSSLSVSQQKSYQLHTKNVLLETMSQDLRKKTEFTMTKNPLLKDFEKSSLRSSDPSVNIAQCSTQNKLLELSESSRKLRGRLTNPLLENQKARCLSLRNEMLSRSSALRFRTKDALLAPSFSLEVSRSTVQTSPEKIGPNEDSDFSVEIGTKVASLSPEDFADVSSLGEKEIAFPSPNEVQQIVKAPVTALMENKAQLVECVCTSLINNPVWFSEADATRTKLYQLCGEIAALDPEFVLKVALYARVELNIRTTCNFLLAAASIIPSCRKFLKKYFEKAIILPSDWIQVAEFYQSLTGPDGKRNKPSLPASLRKVMVSKFPAFDEYQLAKYNKDKSKAGKKKEKKKEKQEENTRDGMKTEKSENKKEKCPEVIVPAFTLKFLIRKLHLKKPAYPVMCILGKKYPKTMDEFHKCGLEGTWDSALSGKRMKLTVPETWETQVSAKGNKAKTWEDLLDHRKLPFMAMLRNLRNMIKAGISDKHHTQVLKTLTNERAVVKSRQFPFRFFSAYEVLSELEREIEKQENYKLYGLRYFLNRVLKDLYEKEKKSFGRNIPKTENEKKLDVIRKSVNKKYATPFQYDKDLIERYRKALDKAVSIATANNVPPIPGHTVVLCDVTVQMLSQKCTTSKGIGSSRTLGEVGILLGLMCAYSCEACTFIICAGTKYKTIELEKGGILKNLTRILALAKIIAYGESSEGTRRQKILNGFLLDKMKMDNLLILSSGMNIHEEQNLGMFLERYKDNVNSKLSCFKVNIAGKRPSVTNEPGVMCFSGYSDQILKFIGLGSADAQVNFVEKIDLRRNLAKLDEVGISVHNRLSNIVRPPMPKPWKTVRIFISSTIKDMGCERDALVQRVFPALKEHAKTLRLHVVETDLRWGITSEDSRHNRSVEICLHEVRNCDIFLGILGERYGWVPKDYGFSEEGSEWLEDYPKKRSITELEIEQAAFQEENKSRFCHFYFRDSSKIKKEIPKMFKDQFFEPNLKKQNKLKDLKNRIMESRHSIGELYLPQWEGVENGMLKLCSLEKFEEDVMNDLWQSVEFFGQNHSDSVLKEQGDCTQVMKQDPHIDIAMQQPFVGRGMLLSGVLRRIRLKQSNNPSVIALVGKAGSGKTALLANLYRKLVEDSTGCVVCVHFAHSSITSSLFPENVLRRFCSALAETFQLEESVNQDSDFESLLGVYKRLIEKLQSHSTSPVSFLLIDDLDSFGDIGWISSLLRDNITIIATCIENEVAHKALKHITGVNFHPVSDLTISDRREIVRASLGQHSKRLDESHFNNQLQVLLSKQEATSPLYLRNVCDMIRTDENFETLGKTLKILPHDLHGTLKWQLRRAERKFSSHRGLVATIFGVVHCSAKWKISESDLYEVLCMRFSGDEDGGNSLSRALVFNALNSLRSFVTSTTTDAGKMLSISHASHQNALEEMYFDAVDFLKSCHSLLAAYFTIKLRQNLGSQTSDTYAVVDAISRLSTHLVHSGQQNVLSALLSDLNYLHYICTLGLGSKLLEDFNFLTEQNESTSGKKKHRGSLLKPWQEMHSFLKSCIHVAAKYPDMIFQEALNQPKESYPYIVGMEILSENEKSKTSKLVCLQKSSECDIRSRPVHTYEYISTSDLTTCIATLPKADVIGFGLLSGKVGILDKQSGKVCNIWMGHVAEITALCFVDKSALLSCSADGMVSAWNVKDGYKVNTFKAHDRRITCIAVRPPSQGMSSRIFVTGSHDSSIAIWNTSKFKLVARISSASPVNSMDFHPQYPRIAAGLWDASIKIWDVQSSKRIAVIRGHSHAVSSVQYSSCGSYIASCSQYEAIIRLWAASSGIPLGNFGEAYLTSPKALAFSNGGEYLLGAGDGTNESAAQLAVWNSRLGCEEIQYHVPDSEEYGNALCCKFNTDKTSLAVGFHEGYICIYDSRIQSAIFSEKIHDSAVTCVTWTPGTLMDSDLFLLFTPETAVDLVITGSMDHTLKALDLESDSVVAILKGHSGPVLSVDATSQWIASGGEDFSILIWKISELVSGEMQQQAMFGNADFTVQSNVASNMSDFGKQKKPKTIKPKRALHAHDGPVSCVAFNLTGTLLVSGGRDGKLAYWSIENLTAQQSNAFQVQRRSSTQKKEILPVASIGHAHMDWITCCSWNDISDHIVTGSNDTTMKIWKVPKLPLLDSDRGYKVPVHVLTGHSSGIASVVFKMGCIASAGGEDCSIRIWSNNGVEITSLKAEARTNCCDIALRVEDSPDEDTFDDIDTGDSNTEIDWANEVDAEEWREEHQKQKPGSKMKRKTLSSEMQNVNVVSAANNAKVELWKPLAGKKVNVMNEQASTVNQIQVSADGQIISRASNGRLKLWNVEPSRNTTRQNGEVTNIIIFDDVIVTTCDAGFVYIWKAVIDCPIRLLNKAKIHGKRITSLCALRKHVFATTSHDGVVAVWAIGLVKDESEQEVKHVNIREKYKTHFDPAAISLSYEQGPRDEKLLWLGHIDGSCSMISLNESLDRQDVKRRVTITKAPNYHLVLGCFPKEQTIISDKGFISDNERIDLDNSEFVHCYAYVRGISSNKTLLVGSSLGFVYYNGTRAKLHDGCITAILDQDSFLMTTSHDCTVKLWLKQTLTQIGQYYTSSPVTCARFLSESEVLYGDSSGMINALKLYNLA